MRGTTLLLIAAIACSRPESASDLVEETAGDAVPDAVALIDGAGGWYDRSRVLDVTGDGVPDTLQLIARGPRTDSLVMALIVRINADSHIVASWASDYDFIDPPEEIRTAGAPRDSALRARYDRVLRDARVQRFVDSTLAKPWAPSRTFFECDENAHHCVMLDALLHTYPTVHIDSLDGLPFDTVAARRVVADFASRELWALTFSYGYESTESVVWSPIAGRFISVFYCC